MLNAVDEGMCPRDGCALVPVEVCDVAAAFEASCWQCPLCQRLYCHSVEMEIDGVKIERLQSTLIA
jgi:hypothetical protein